MPDLSRPERLQIMLSAEELQVLDDWRFKRRMPSRAAAIRDLLRRGLAAEGIDLAPTGKQSSGFGVLPGAEA
jgi:metal-responsive CopG/Arc/MetJ family transcriptional regulator